MINCPECGKEISDRAKKCPKCGYPISKNKSKKIICIVALAVIMLLAVSGTYYLENRRETEQEQVDNVVTTNSGKVTPSFKATMDSYEEFFDKYVAFMKKYNEADSNDYFAMLSDYAEMLTKYAEMTEAMDDIDTDSLSTADYAYYIEVTARIYVKLLEATN
jgi:uncharacterized Zn finger protein (UPF0148 family)